MISEDHFFCFKLGLGHSTNTRSELLALWTLLHHAKCMGLPHLQILGAYAIIINWFNHQSTLSLLTLDGWCHLIRELDPHFIHPSAIHIYIEHNTFADSLSKEYLTLDLGQLHYLEFTNGDCIHQGSFYLF